MEAKLTWTIFMLDPVKTLPYLKLWLHEVELDYRAEEQESLSYTNTAMENTGYKKLIVYQRAKGLVLVVEGYVKSSRKEFVRFLDISIGSAAELGLHLDISYELGYLNKKRFDILTDLLIEVKKLLYSYQKSLRKSVRLEV